jgi:hypothetical protein
MQSSDAPALPNWGGTLDEGYDGGADPGYAVTHREATNRTSSRVAHPRPHVAREQAYLRAGSMPAVEARRDTMGTVRQGTTQAARRGSPKGSQAQQLQQHHSQRNSRATAHTRHARHAMQTRCMRATTSPELPYGGGIEPGGYDEPGYCDEGGGAAAAAAAGGAP